MSSSQPAASIPSGGSAPSSSQPLASASASTTANGVGTAVTPASGTSGTRNDASPKQASSKTSSSGAYRDEYDEEDADCDDDDDEVDPRYAIDSYQSSSKSSAPGGISSSNAQPSNKHVVFDAASHAAENRAGSSQGGQARGSHLPAWGSAALARGQNQTQEQQQQGIPSSSSRSTLPDHFSYATSHGVQLSSLCFAAWAFPPFSSVLVLVWETENVRMTSNLDVKRILTTPLSPTTTGPRPLPRLPSRHLRRCARRPSLLPPQLAWRIYSLHHRRHGWTRLVLGLWLRGVKQRSDS